MNANLKPVPKSTLRDEFEGKTFKRHNVSVTEKDQEAINRDCSANGCEEATSIYKAWSVRTRGACKRFFSRLPIEFFKDAPPETITITIPYFVYAGLNNIAIAKFKKVEHFIPDVLTEYVAGTDYILRLAEEDSKRVKRNQELLKATLSDTEGGDDV